jgi:alanyl aminopeptidase
VVPTAPRFEGQAVIEIQLDRPRDVIWLHGRGLNVTRAEIAVAGRRTAVRWEQVDPDGVARVTLPQPVGPGRAILRLAWDAAWGTRAAGCFRSRAGGDLYAVTHFEAIAARSAFPGFDEPVFKTPFEVTLTVRAADVAVGNAPIVEERPVAGGLKRVRFAPTQPLPTYLVAWATGPFDVVAPPPLPPNEVRTRPLAVRGLAPRGRGPELAYALKVGGELLVALERTFGIPFPYEKLDHAAFAEFFGGAMENAGLITYQDGALLYRDGVSRLEARSEIAEVMAHEMAHQWFGDLVTLSWWTDTWLNESFATWMASRTVSAWNPALQTAVGDTRATAGVMEGDTLASARAIRQPVTRTAQIDDQFDMLTYTKGGAVLGMFERWLGREVFRRGVHEYLVAHAHGTGDTTAFFAAISKAAGRDVAPSFRTFLDQPGAPLIAAKVACAAGGARLELEQSRYLPVGARADRSLRWQVPVCARFGLGGRTVEACTLLTERTGVIAVPGGRCPDWVMPSAAGEGYYRWTLAPADLARLRRADYVHLTTPERLALVYSLRAGLRSGAVSYADALATLAPLVRDPDPSVAAEPIQVLHGAREHLVPAGLVPRVDAFASKLYRPVLKQLTWHERKGDLAEHRRLREDVVRFLCLGVRDPVVRREAARLGRAWVAAPDDQARAKVVGPDLARFAVAVAVQEEGAKLFDDLVARLQRTDDSPTRGVLIAALASASDPALMQRALGLILGPVLRTQERDAMLWPMAMRPEGREVVWRFVKERLDQLLPHFTYWMRGGAPFLAVGFCDERHAADVEAFFAARRATLPEALRTTAQAAESIRLCAAYADHHRASATAFFSAKR